MSSDTLQAFNPEDLTVEQIDLIKRTICHGASDDELKLFVFQCNRTKLDPFSRQIYSMAYGGRRSVVISIDGARLIAERSGRYQGQTPQEWCGADGIWRDVWLRNEPPSAARIGVYRSGNPHPTYAVANFKAYRPAKSSMWDKMPELMISKVAEMLALRKAFPHDLSGLYSHEEMEQASTPKSNKPPPLSPKASLIWEKAKQKMNGRTASVLSPIIFEKFKENSFLALNSDQLDELDQWIEGYTNENNL